MENEFSRVDNAQRRSRRHFAFVNIFLGWFSVVGGAFLQGDCDLHRCHCVVFSLAVSAILGSFAGSYGPRCGTANFFLSLEIYFVGWSTLVRLSLRILVAAPSFCRRVIRIRTHCEICQ